VFQKGMFTSILLYPEDGSRKFLTCCCENVKSQWGTLQQTDFMNKIRMLQQTQRNTISWRSSHACMTYRAFPLWSEHQSLSLLLFVRFSYQFSSVICLFVPLAVIFFLFCCIILAMNWQNRVRKLINLDIKKEITLLYSMGLEQITPKYMYFSVC